MPGVDRLVLHPFEAFFVQRPEDSGEILFASAGRVANIASRLRQATAYSALHTINLSVGDARTRVVINEEASLDYELTCDAAKFFGPDVDLYTLQGDDAMAINERPSGNGLVRLGFSCHECGEYTIVTDTPVILIDKELGIQTVLDEDGYTFESASGRNDYRFELNVVADAISPVKAESNGGYYTICGMRIDGKPQCKGIYLNKDRKVVVRKE